MTGASTTPADDAREASVEAALAALDLDAKTRLLAGQDQWSLPALPEIGLPSLVMSDGPVGVRGVRWTPDDPSAALPSPTALAASWDPALARRAGRLLAQEARRKGVHVLLAPTVNLHRSPLGGRHFEAYSEDPYLTGEIGTGYVRGVQDGGVGTTVKHFVANDAETDRFTVDNVVSRRALRELYLAPFEAIVTNARPWGVMAAYNTVNGSSMTENRRLQLEVLRGEWGFDGAIVSDWLAARSTVGAALGGLDIAMPGPVTVYGEKLAAAVRAGEVEESAVDAAARNVLRLAARVGILPGVAGAGDEPRASVDGEAVDGEAVDGDAVTREIARRSFVLLRNEARDGHPALPIDPARTPKVALIGAAARDARILGGGSATVFPAHVVAPLDGLSSALPEGSLTYAVGADPNTELSVAGGDFELAATARAADGRVLATVPLPDGRVQWVGSDLPDGVDYDELAVVEVAGTFTARDSGEHAFGTRGLGGFTLTVDGTVLYEGRQEPAESSDPFEAFFGVPTERGRVRLESGSTVEVSLRVTVFKVTDAPMNAIGFSLLHLGPQRDPDEMIAEAALTAAAADTAVVVVATTERVESEGFDRRDLRLPGRQDDLVRAVAAANPHTLVVVNTGSPVEMDWRDDVAAVLLSWFPGQQGGAALADVLLGAEEPGGRLPTTWPAALADAPVVNTTPSEGQLRYEEGVFIGYRAWEKAGTAPAYAFGHGLGYTEWHYETVDASQAEARVRLRNAGARHGREVVQLYVAPQDAPSDAPERPARWLAGFATVEAAPGETVEVAIPLRRRAFEIWDETADSWSLIEGRYEIQVAHSLADVRLSAPLTVER
ncbi:beta-glucosidase family protein [Streptomyces montanisoli]|uniref:Glycoside hydrolase family 3 C-terminal domain-containing protein n=1 Tax=Streptomyces montanisoli TaxID=2798581 RepID=A0A940RVK7_9ACTN|nr:glycoside hydrolase family 3 C-terminal domain-containing protein [Streptomyces montanisoli]MBP0458346.1 glycoside hydrolase family 3 C-terminal domain-containing protein [Streptomyces montanisoli]